MNADGRKLEQLVAFVEETLLPKGFSVKTNERIYDDRGVHIAEFDIEIHGRVGSTDIAWLIECRDRPSDGPAPSAWIEQLAGRRMRFAFNKVTAVSTTGFSEGAAVFAAAQGIELREVQSLVSEAFADWLHIRALREIKRAASLHHARLTPGESPKLEATLKQFLSTLPGNAPFLRSVDTGDLVSAPDAFLGAVTAAGTLFDGLEPKGPGRRILLEVRYERDDDHFVVDVPGGRIRIHAIVFAGELTIQETDVPLLEMAEYRRSPSGEAISQVASFAPQQFGGLRFTMEMNLTAGSGDTHVVLRRLSDDPARGT